MLSMATCFNKYAALVKLKQKKKKLFIYNGPLSKASHKYYQNGRFGQ